MWWFTPNNGMMWWMILTSLLAVGFAAIILTVLVRTLSRTGEGPRRTPNTPETPSALELLRMRYARGEIDTATFQEMKARLEETEYGASASTPPPPRTPTSAG